MSVNVKDLRHVGHEAVTEGVNLKYVERMRQALYAAADRIEELEAGAPAALAYWIVRDEGDKLAYWGPFASDGDARASHCYDRDESSAVVPLAPNPVFAGAKA